MLVKDMERIKTGSKLLLLLLQAGYYHQRIYDSTNFRKALFAEWAKARAERQLYNLIYKLTQKGWIKTERTEGKKIIKLTSKGELEALFVKARLPIVNPRWDGKWRIVVFDIPESARHIRDKLRLLLKQLGFKPLQASVYISPYPINTAAISYLHESKLIRYIRIFRVDQFDNTKDLLKAFHLKPAKNHLSKNSRP